MTERKPSPLEKRQLRRETERREKKLAAETLGALLDDGLMTVTISGTLAYDGRYTIGTDKAFTWRHT